MHDSDTSEPDAQDRNLTWHQNRLAPAERRAAMGQGGAVLWLTGLSGSGKSTLAMALEQRLVSAGRVAYVLDGDNVRHGLNGDLGFGDADRTENIRRVGHVAALFADAGVICIAAFISPFAADRDAIRQRVPQGRFFEVHVATPIEVCETRDPKGLYRRARAGEIARFTGIDSPYEPPRRAEAVIDTQGRTLDACVDDLEGLLTRAGIFDG